MTWYLYIVKMYSTISQFTGDSVTVQMQQSKTDEVFCIYVTCFQIRWYCLQYSILLQVKIFLYRLNFIYGVKKNLNTFWSKVDHFYELTQLSFVWRIFVENKSKYMYIICHKGKICICMTLYTCLPWKLDILHIHVFIQPKVCIMLYPWEFFMSRLVAILKRLDHDLCSLILRYHNLNPNFKLHRMIRCLTLLYNLFLTSFFVFVFKHWNCW